MISAVFDGMALSSGVYVAWLDTAGRTSQVKVALVK